MNKIQFNIVLFNFELIVIWSYQFQEKIHLFGPDLDTQQFLFNLFDIKI